MSSFSRSFYLSLWARLSGNSANQMLLVALGWQMYDLTSSAWDLGLVGLYQFLPAIIFTIPAGQLADRVDRRNILAYSLALQLVVAGVLAWGSAGGWVSRELILALGVVLGSARALQAPALQSIVPSLVATSELPRALALSSGTLKVSIIGGPAIGGFLYAFGPAIAYGTCVFFLAAAVVLVTMIQPCPPRVSKEQVTFKSLFAGIGYIRDHPVILGALSLDLFAVLLGGVIALLPMFARDVLHTGPWGLGLLRASPAVGGLIVAAWLARSPLKKHVGKTMLGAVAVYGVAIFAFAFSRDFVLSTLLLAVSGAADMVSVVIRQSLVQLETPDEMRGRVSAVNGTFIQASNQLGDFRAGAMAEWLGAIGSVIVGAIGTLAIVAIWWRLFPSLVQREQLTSGPR